MVRISGPFGILLMITYHFAHMDWPFIESHLNLFVDFHLVYAVVIAYLMAHNAGRVWGIDALLAQWPTARSRPMLRCAFGIEP
jgi:hypothetical protein